MNRLGVHLTLNLRDVDHLRGRVGAGDQVLAGGRGWRGFRQSGDRGRAVVAGRGIGAQDALDQRPYHHEHHDEAEQHHDDQLDQVHDVVLGELQHPHEAGRLVDRQCGGAFGEAQVYDLDLIAALLVEADGRAHQRGNAIELFLVARLIDQLALVVLAVDAIDQNGDRDAVDAACLGHLGLGDARNLVVVGLFALLGLVARGGRIVLALVARQFVVHRHLAVAVVGGSG